jgi:hypothetical protein
MQPQQQRSVFSSSHLQEELQHEQEQQMQAQVIPYLPHLVVPSVYPQQFPLQSLQRASSAAMNGLTSPSAAAFMNPRSVVTQPGPSLISRKRKGPEFEQQQQQQELLQETASPDAKRTRATATLTGALELQGLPSFTPQQQQEQQQQLLPTMLAHHQELLQLQQQDNKLGHGHLQQRPPATAEAEPQEPEEEMADAYQAAAVAAGDSEPSMEDEEMLDNEQRRELTRQLLQKILMEQMQVPRPLPLPPLPPPVPVERDKIGANDDFM